MASDEQRVRTMCGWIGVEISRSRVRTPGKAGYGLYRVRSRGRWWTAAAPPLVRRGMPSAAGAWTPYGFTLTTIESAVRNSIQQGRPERPMDLAIGRSDLAVDELIDRMDETSMIHMDTRWTSAYRGRRDLGVIRSTCEGCNRREAGGPGCPAHDSVMPAGRIKPEVAAEMDALVALLGAGLVEMKHIEGCACDEAVGRFTAACVRQTMTTRQRRRVDNDAFQAEHLRRREFGVAARHAAKTARMHSPGTTET